LDDLGEAGVVVTFFDDFGDVGVAVGFLVDFLVVGFGFGVDFGFFGFKVLAGLSFGFALGVDLGFAGILDLGFFGGGLLPDPEPPDFALLGPKEKHLENRGHSWLNRVFSHKGLAEFPALATCTDRSTPAEASRSTPIVFCVPHTPDVLTTASKLIPI
jgi:hypothetical protein